MPIIANPILVDDDGNEGWEDDLSQHEYDSSGPYKNISSIIFTGDIFRPVDNKFLPSQTKNIRWLAKILSRILFRATNLPFKILDWNIKSKNVDHIYEELDISKDIHGWASLYDRENKVDAFDNYLEKECKESIVIGFEMSPIMCRAMSILNILYVNFKIDPIRFLPDVFFAISSNNSQISNAIEKHKIDEEQFYLWADIISAGCLKRTTLDIPWNSQLILGQVSTDRSLVFNRKIVNLSNYMEDIKNNAIMSRPLYYKSHPYDNSDFGIHALEKEGFNVIKTDKNIYRLMASKRVNTLLSISSGSLTEAKYFGQDTKRLDNSKIEDDSISVYDAFLEADFWRDILGCCIHTTLKDGVKFNRPANTIRNSLNNFWGFDEILTDYNYNKFPGEKVRESLLTFDDKKNLRNDLRSKNSRSNQAEFLHIHSESAQNSETSNIERSKIMHSDKNEEKMIGLSRVDRIVICSDPIMTSEKEQKSNRQWLRDLISRPIRRSCTSLVDGFSSSITSSSSLNRETFFSLSNIDFDINATHFWYDAAKISDRSYSYLLQYLNATTLVVGYELSHQTRSVFTELKIPYIDIWLHPVRFLDDVVFGMHSNVRSINIALDHFAVSEDLIFMYADRLKIQSYKGFRRRSVDIPKNSTIFIGQTNNDKSLLANGKFLNLLDFKDRFQKVVDTSERVFYSRHPFVRLGDEAIIEYISSFKNVEITSLPSYTYIMQENLKNVCTISSSLGVEAKYFSKKSDIFYKTVIPVDTSVANHYRGILQDLVSPQFWASILNGVADVRANAPKLEFTDKKDKLRDMLAFYWSYSSIDKVEDLRQTFFAFQGRIDKAVSQIEKQFTQTKLSQNIEIFRQETQPSQNQKITNHFTSRYDLESKFAEKIKLVEVVSFDLFDTLVTRLVDSPDEIINRIKYENIILPLVISREDFVSARKKARNDARAAGDYNGDEVSLLQRYKAVARSIGVSETLAAQLEEAEEKADWALIQPNRLGIELLKIAQSMGKRTIVTTDTYYRQQFILDILHRIGISGLESVFNSSVVGLTKHSSKMYEHICSAMNTDSSNVIHVGDNLQADVTNASKCGIQAFYVPSIAAISDKGVYPSKITFGDKRFDAVCKGIIQNRLYQLPEPRFQASFSGGEASRLGYIVFGPLLFGLAKWVLEKSIAKKSEKILFLSRDGEIVHRACNLMAQYFDGSPELEYVFASRRALSLPLCQSLEDIIKIAKESFSPTNLSGLLFYRFHITPDQVPLAALHSSGFKSVEDEVSVSRDLGRIEKILTELSSVILNRANQEKDVYLRHLALKIGKSEKLAIMDIGHLGSLQAKLIKISGIEDIGGLYLTTHDGIRDRIKAPAWYESYLRSELSQKSTDSYNKYILLIELMFLNKEGSFVCFEDNKSGEACPVFRSTDGEEARLRFAKKLHEGAIDFVKMALSLLRSETTNLQLDPGKLSEPMFDMFKNPSYYDSKVFSNVSFENLYSGRGFRNIISTQGTPEQMISKSIWREGLNAYLAGEPFTSSV